MLNRIAMENRCSIELLKAIGRFFISLLGSQRVACFIVYERSLLSGAPSDTPFTTPGSHTPPLLSKERSQTLLLFALSIFSVFESLFPVFSVLFLREVTYTRR